MKCAFIASFVFFLSLNSHGNYLSCADEFETWPEKAHEFFNSWNRDNREFYDQLAFSDFVSRSYQCGLGTCIDLRQREVQELLEWASNRPHGGSVLEIGGGFGRVLSYLNLETKIMRIVTIEHSAVYANHLRGTFTSMGRNSHLSVWTRSIVTFASPQPQFDLALWMWAGFFELNPYDKVRALRNVYQSLYPGGYLILDVPPNVTSIARTVGFRVENNFLHLNLSNDPNDPTLHLHFYDEKDILKLVEHAGFTHEKTVVYEPDLSPKSPSSAPNTQRTLLIFRKH